MEQNLRFGLVGSTEKKIWADYEQLLRVFFFMFSRAKKICKYMKVGNKHLFSYLCRYHFGVYDVPSSN